MRLYVLERTNGWYGGYYEENGELVQAFNTSAALLFMSIKRWYERGYTDLVFVDSLHEDEFRKRIGAPTLGEYLSAIFADEDW